MYPTRANTDCSTRFRWAAGLFLAGLIIAGCAEKTVRTAKPRGESKPPRVYQPGDGAGEDQQDPAEQNGIDLSLVHEDHFAGAIIDVPRVLQNPTLADVPWQELMNGLQKQFGDVLGDPQAFEYLLVLVDQQFFSLLPDFGQPSKPQTSPVVVAAKLNRSIDVTALQRQLAEFWGQAMEQWENQERLWINRETNTAVYVKSDDLLMVGSIPPVTKLVDLAPANTGFAQRLTGLSREPEIVAVLLMSPIRPTLRSVLGPFRRFSPQLRESTDALELIDCFSATFALNGPTLFSATIEVADEKNLDKIVGQMRNGVGNVGQMSSNMVQVQSQIDQNLMTTPTSLGQWQAVLADIADGGVTVAKRDSQIQIDVRRPKQLEELVSAVIADFRVQQELEARMTRLGKVAQALRQYHDQQGQFPSPDATLATAAEPAGGAFSWRVAVLPQLGYAALYEQFDFSQPWDSPHNLQVAREMPAEYRTTLADERTTLHLPGGSGAFRGPQPPADAQIKDGLERTVLLIEGAVDSACVWTQPGKLELVPQQPLPELGREGENGILAAMFDGEVKIISRSSEESIRELLTPDGGESISRRAFLSLGQ